MEVTFSKKSGWLAKKVWKMHSEGIRIACLDFKIKLKKIYQINIYIYIYYLHCQIFSFPKFAIQSNSVCWNILETVAGSIHEVKNRYNYCEV